MRLTLTFGFSVILATLFASCVHSSRTWKPENVRLSANVRVLSPVDEDVLSFTNAVIVTSYVWVDVLAPSDRKKDRVRLILHRSAAQLGYKRPLVGEEWQAIGGVIEIEAVLNRDSNELFLYPPVGVPPGEVVF
jgi:hypothetical protein